MNTALTNTRVNHVSIFVSLAVLIFSAVAAAQDPPLEQLSLMKDGTSAKPDGSAPKTIRQGVRLTISCGAPAEGVDCARVRVSTSVGTELLKAPTEDERRSIKEGNTRAADVPHEKPGTTLQIRYCAEGQADAACASSAPVHQLTIVAGQPQVESADPIARRQFCQQVGARQRLVMLNARTREDFTVVLFDANGPCYMSRQTAAEGDPIMIGYVRGSAEQDVVNVDLDPCGTASPIPKVLIGADASAVVIPQAAEITPTRFTVEWFPPVRRCFGTSAGIKVAVGIKEPKQHVLTLKLYERYRATLQIGAIWSDRHQRTFTLRPDGEQKLITETSATERGPEYIASVVIYGLPRYFWRPEQHFPGYVHPTGNQAQPFKLQHGDDTLRREPYMGRDPVNENGVQDRIGLLFGVGMNQPGRRFIVGASFELLTGVNFFSAAEFVRAPDLVGYRVGDPFVGEAKDITVQDHLHRGASFGVTLDARYALALFGRK